jgi:hypothetical protein
MRTGRVPRWEAHLVVYSGDDMPALTTLVWLQVRLEEIKDGVEVVSPKGGRGVPGCVPRTTVPVINRLATRCSLNSFV